MYEIHAKVSFSVHVGYICLNQYMIVYENGFLNACDEGYLFITWLCVKVNLCVEVHVEAKGPT